MALDDFEDRFATAVKLALDASRGSGDDQSDAGGGAECPAADAIASYYEFTLNRGERARLETHFSGCARCQGTLAALLRAAPMVDTASEAGGFAAAAARRAAAESGRIRERWFGISPAWRIAGTIAAATAMLTVVVIAVGAHHGRRGRVGERVIALNAASLHRNNEAHPSSGNNELALNERRSLVPAAPGAPKAATVPSAGAANAPVRAFGAYSGASAGASAGTSSAAPSSAASPASTGEATAGSSTSAEPPLPFEEAAPPDTEQDEATAGAAAQAAAALGALAVTPAPAATAAPSIATPAAEASAAAAATPLVTTPPTPAGSTAGESHGVPAETAPAPAAGAIEGGMAASIAANAAATPASETTASAPTAKAPGAVKQMQPERAEIAASMSRPQYPQHGSVAETPSDASALWARQQAQQQLVKERLAKHQLAEEKHEAELALKAQRAKWDADLKRQMESARREALARSSKLSTAGTSSFLPAPQSGTSIHMQTPGAPQPTAPSGTASAGAGNETAMAERPVASAPAIAPLARGIPVAPHALLISPADHSIYWSLQNSGVIYRSNDRKSWTPEYTGMPAEFLAGMAPSDKVCWAVGRKGVILLTRDGIHWERVNSPTASDVIGITAASKDVATIFTAGGVTYSTFDGGSNWQQAN